MEQDTVVGRALFTADWLWETDKVKQLSEENLHILMGAAVRIFLECGSEESRRYGRSSHDPLCSLQDPSVRRTLDEALSVLHLANVPSVPAVV